MGTGGDGRVVLVGDVADCEALMSSVTGRVRVDEEFVFMQV